jgi:predicted dehydrogenase
LTPFVFEKKEHFKKEARKMTTLRIGIIGFGGSGPAHAYYYTRVPGCKVTKIFDPKEGGMVRAKKLAPTATTYQDLKDFWADLDAVSVCSPDSTHADYIAQALEHGLHVICEKPLTDSIEGIRKVKKAEKKSDRIVAVLHQMRFVPLHKIMHGMMRKKSLGPVSYLEGYYVHDLTHRGFENDDWRQRDNATPLVYSGCHFVDLLRWLAGEEIVEVYAAANNIAFPKYPESDLNVVTMKFKNGVIGKVLVAFGAPCHQDHSVRIYGRDGVIENNLLFRSHAGWEVLHSPRIIQNEHIRNLGLLQTFRETMLQVQRNLRYYLLGKIFEGLSLVLGSRRNGEYCARFYPIRLYEHSAACIESIADFIKAIRTGSKPLCTVDESAKAVLACLAGVESYRTGQPVKVKTLEEVLSGAGT